MKHLIEGGYAIMYQIEPTYTDNTPRVVVDITTPDMFVNQFAKYLPVGLVRNLETQHMLRFASSMNKVPATGGIYNKHIEPKHQANIGLQQSWIAQRLHTNLLLNHARELFDIGGVPLANYTLVNATATYQLSQALKLNTRIENLFDREYQEVAGYHTSGLAFYIGIQASL
jgi:outer membrane receptor for ferrienterochelin and colicin